MEGCVEMYVNFFYNYQKKFFTIKDFFLVINKYNEKDKSSSFEKMFHVKYLEVQEIKQNIVELRYKKDTSIEFRTDNEEDVQNWVDAIKKEKIKYDKFLDDYYVNNTSYKLISSKNSSKYHSVYEYICDINKFISELEVDINDFSINPQLESLVTILNRLINNIDCYTSNIEKYYNKLNPSKNEDRHLLNKTNEIKVLFDELREFITSSMYGLNQNEINIYIKNLKENLVDKIRDIRFIQDEIEYLTKNYLLLSLNKIKDWDLEKDQKRYSNLVIESELLSMKIDNLKNETEIIKQFINEYD